MQRMIEPITDDKVLQKDIEKYLKQVKRGLIVSSKIRKRYLAHITEVIGDFLDLHPDADFDRLIAHLGTPQRWWDEALKEYPPSKLRRYMHRNTWARIVLTVLVVLILGAGATFALERILYAANGNPILLVQKPEYIDGIPSTAKRVPVD